MKNIIFNTNNIISLFFFNYKIFSKSSNFKKRKQRDQVIYDSLWTASDGRDCDYLSDQIVCEIYEDINQDKLDFLKKWGGVKFNETFIKHSILKEVRKIVWQFKYADKVCNYYKLKGKIFFWPNLISIKLYKKIKDNQILPQHIKIHPFARIYLIIFEILKTLYFSFNLFFFLERKLLSIKFNKKKIRNKYLAGVVIDDGQFQKSLKDKKFSICDEKIMNIVDKNNTLIINDSSKKVDRKWISLTILNDYSAINLDDISSYISKMNYVRRYYVDDFFLDLIFSVLV